jgi:hypothetical protein
MGVELQDRQPTADARGCGGSPRCLVASAESVEGPRHQNSVIYMACGARSDADKLTRWDRRCVVVNSSRPVLRACFHCVRSIRRSVMRRVVERV